MQHNTTTSAGHLLMLFLLLLLLFFGAHMALPFFIGTDVLYHLTHAEHIARFGTSFLTATDWLPYHFFTNHPVNPYVLYHLILAGIIAIGVPPIMTQYIVSSMLAAGIYTTIYSICRRYMSTRSALISLAIALALSPPFLYRLFLDRPFVISILASIMIVIVLTRRTYLLAAFVTMLAVLCYNLSVLLILPAMVVSLVQYATERTLSLRPIISVLVGIAIGLIIHPHTLNYILLIKVHLIDIFLLPLQGVQLPSGEEILPLAGQQIFFANHIPLMIGWMTSLVVLGARLITPPTSMKPLLYSMGILSILWFPVSIAIHRGIEYWVPTATMTLLLTLSLAYRTWLPRRPHLWILHLAIGGVLIAILFPPMVRLWADMTKTAEQQQQLVNDMQVAVATIDMSTTTLLWYPAWSMFPVIWYSLPQPISVQGIAAFDPIFSYLYSPYLYTRMTDARTDKRCRDASMCLTSLERLANALDIHYFIIPEEAYYETLRMTINQQNHMLLRHQNTSFRVYELIR